jgi:hypothetical protein
MTDTRILTDEQARTVAAHYQSSGTIGSVLAAVASGLKAGRHRVIDDIDATRRELIRQEGAWEELTQLKAWARTTDALSGPADGFRVITNHQPRPIVRWWDLTEQEQSAIDYLTPSQCEDREWVRYRGEVYDINDTEGPAPDALKARGWGNYWTDSFYSGMVVRYFDADGQLIDDGDSVVIGRFYIEDGA